MGKARTVSVRHPSPFTRTTTTTSPRARSRRATFAVPGSVEQLEGRRLLSVSAQVAYMDDAGAYVATSSGTTINWHTGQPLFVSAVQRDFTRDASGNPTSDPVTGVADNATTTANEAAISREQASFSWDFGDAGSLSNRTPGFSSGHVYATAGDYTLSLRVASGSDDADAQTATVTVHVSDPTYRTYYVAAAGTGDGSSDAAAMSIDALRQGLASGAVGSNSKVLFKAGDTFVVTDPKASQGNTGELVGSLELASQSNVVFDRYGAGADPLFKKDAGTGGATVFMTTPSSSRVTIQHLAFANDLPATQPDGQGHYRNTILVLQAAGKGVALQHCTFTDLGKGSEVVVANTGGAAGLFLQDNKVLELNGNGHIHYFLYDDAMTDVVILDNDLHVQTGGTEGLIRIDAAESNHAGNDPVVRRVLIADNNTGAGLTNEDGAVLRLHDVGYVWVANNKITAAVTAVAVGPGRLYSTVPAAQTQFMVLDGNDVTGPVSVGGGTHYTIVRNNVLHALGGDSWGYLLVVEGPGTYTDFDGVTRTDPVAEQVFILNNTGVADTSAAVGQFSGGYRQEAFLRVHGAQANGLTVANNLYSMAPIGDAAGDYKITGSGGWMIDVPDNPTLAGFTSISHNVWPDIGSDVWDDQVQHNVTDVAIRVGSTLVRKADWTSANYPVVSGDVFSDVAVSDGTDGKPKYAPETAPPGAPPVAGVFADLYGTARLHSAASWTPGAVETGTSVPPDEPPGTNLVQNPGFEDGFSPWGNWGGMSVSTAEHHSGSASAYAGLSGDGFAQTVSGLTPGVTYVLSAWVKTPNGKPVEIGADSYGTQFGAQANADTAVTGWQELRVEFTPEPGNTTANVFAWFANHGDAWVDDVSVTPKQANLLQNAGFEDGMTDWGTWSGTGATTTTGHVHSGTTAGTLGSIADGLFQNVGLAANTTYVLSAWVWASAGQTVMIGVNNFNGPNNFASANSAVTGSWQQVSLEFTTGSTAPAATVYAYIGQAGDVWVDDFQLSVKP